MQRRGGGGGEVDESPSENGANPRQRDLRRVSWATVLVVSAGNYGIAPLLREPEDGDREETN